ncbi:hypothetical protein CR513_36945, partial [Mucuna pruriens]
MARFLHGLNREIQDIVELYQYGSLEDLVHQSTKGKEREKERRDKSPKKRIEVLQGQQDVVPPPPLVPPSLVVLSVSSVWERGALPLNALIERLWS